MTPDQRAVLSRVVVDPDSWYRHVLDKFGKERADTMLEDKCKRHAFVGGPTRAEREAQREAQEQQRRADHAQRREEARAQKDADLIALIDQRIELALKKL